MLDLQWRNQSFLSNGQILLVPEKNGGQNGQDFY
jgi:hypothetical protein